MQDNKEFSLKDFDALVYSRKYNEAAGTLIRLLGQFEKGYALDSLPDMAPAAYTRLAAAVTTLFTDANFKLLPRGFENMALFHRNLQAVFRMSAFENADHILSIIGEQDSGNRYKIPLNNKQKVFKFFLCYSLYSGYELDFPVLFRHVPDALLALYFALLSQEVFLNSPSYALRQKLLKMGPLIEDLLLPDYLLVRLSNAWMLCSYDDSKDKHRIKLHLNRMLQKWMHNKGVRTRDIAKERTLKEKPTLLVIAEYFSSLHAVFRCYGIAMDQLRKKFRLVLMAEPDKIDNGGKALFDEVITVEPGSKRIEKIVDKIVKVKPDIIYYPSLGMREWTIPLASLRLSPIQFVTMGHPATTCSPCMDYVILGPNHFGEADLFSEKIVLHKDPFPMELRHDARQIEPELRESPSLLKIAVSGASFKQNPSIMESCRRIKKNSGRDIEFHFFSDNVRGLQYQHYRHEVLRWIPNSHVYRRADYNTYIANLNRCDIYLGTFPFGGTNTNVDCLMQGIPGVVYEGMEPHSRLDSRVVRLFGMPEWLIARNKEEYEEAALRLIQNDEERIALARMALSNNAREVLQKEKDCFADEFVESVWWLYCNHEAVQQDGRKVWTWEMRQGAGPSAREDGI